MHQELALHLLRHPKSDDNKFKRGVLGFVTGSDAYPGAALLGIDAAVRTGIGMVRYLGPDSVNRLVLETRPETVCKFGEADAWVLGSGVDKSDGSRAAAVLEASILPALKVIDAGALEVIDYAKLNAYSAILTPHAGELARLLDRFGRHFDLDYEAVQAAAALTRQVVILKGNTSLVAHPSGEVTAVGPNSVSLATAGTGDVLAGIIGALLAVNAHDPELDLVDVATLGIAIHSEAADRASKDGPVAALDVAEAVRSVIRDWQNRE
jgi:hydroxyethylthiazole kinase-like uncharacterized protein yjeF